MAPLPTIGALCAVSLLLLSATEAAAVDSSAAHFADTHVTEDGTQLEVADPVGDPTESDSIQQDSTAAWQLEMINGLYAQRKAEKEFIQRLNSGGEGLNAMVNNIAAAFSKLEKLRQQRGATLIKAHFDKEIQLLKESSQKILSNLSSALAAQSSDSAAVKSLKAQVTAIFSKGFSQQLQNEANLFKKQMKQIEEEHAKQNGSVQDLFSLLRGWKDSFRTGLKKSEKRLDEISESWDML